ESEDLFDVAPGKELGAVEPAQARWDAPVAGEVLEEECFDPLSFRGNGKAKHRLPELGLDGDVYRAASLDICGSPCATRCSSAQEVEDFAAGHGGLWPSLSRPWTPSLSLASLQLRDSDASPPRGTDLRWTTRHLMLRACTRRACPRRPAHHVAHE